MLQAHGHRQAQNVGVSMTRSFSRSPCQVCLCRTWNLEPLRSVAAFMFIRPFPYKRYLEEPSPCFRTEQFTLQETNQKLAMRALRYSRASLLQAIFISHSYGTFVMSWVLQFRRGFGGKRLKCCRQDIRVWMGCSRRRNRSMRSAVVCVCVCICLFACLLSSHMASEGHVLIRPISKHEGWGPAA